jgi:uncharacterized cupin superfamily protein
MICHRHRFEYMTTKKIISLSSAPEGFGQDRDTLDSEDFVSALPIQHTHTYYHDEELGLEVGVWDTTDMIETAGPYPCDEFMLLLEGEAVIRNCNSGELEKAKAGEAFVIPKGYDCQWQQSGYLRKYFLISENPDESIPEKPVVEGIIIPGANTRMKSLSSSGPFLKSNHYPNQQQHICYENNTRSFLAGTWESALFESSPGVFPYNVFACVMAGSLILIDEDKKEHHFEPGDAMFIPQGVLCGARVSNKTKLSFAIVKSAQDGDG